ncbi:EPG5 [Branchiostoma lanceolatum]|uniref:EPG5 protein n=1 Tax=Branchiostoma lanceolatum TaxID=7740 RepID=A0A8K0EKS6_BRALA|nr:EPG5 [Branchiostoma lanceolatum]
MAEAERKPRSRKTKVKTKVTPTAPVIRVSRKDDSAARQRQLDSTEGATSTSKPENHPTSITQENRTVPKDISEEQVENKDRTTSIQEQDTKGVTTGNEDKTVTIQEQETGGISSLKEPIDTQENVQANLTSDEISPKPAQDNIPDEKPIELQDKGTDISSSNQVTIPEEVDIQDEKLEPVEEEQNQMEDAVTESAADTQTFQLEIPQTDVLPSNEPSEAPSEETSMPTHVPDAVVKEESRTEVTTGNTQVKSAVNLTEAQEEDDSVQSEQFPAASTDTYAMSVEETHSEDILPERFAQPLTEEQLQSLYDNPLLPQLEEWVDCFLQQTNQNKHEFYQLVQQYYRSRVSLAEVQTGITDLQSRQEQLEGQLWITTDHVVTAQGYCHDNVKVSQTQNYHQVELSGVACVELSRVLHDTRVQVHEMYALAGYSAMLCRLQVETYLHQVLSSGCTNPDTFDPSLTAERDRVRSCISVLFTFQRRPIRDQQFLEDTQKWIEKLCCCLLTAATFHDHLFLLNHVLRCPSGVGAWAASLIQVPCPLPDDATDVASAKVHQFLVMLATLFNPIRSRLELLKLLKPVQVGGQTQEQADAPLNWTLVDEGGEEEDDSADTWALLHENDLVMLLQQFPFNRFFCYIMNVHLSDSDIVVSDVTEQHMLWIFALCSTLVKLLSEGLRNFNRSRYRQFVKRLGRLVRHTIQHVSEVWRLCKGRLEHAQGDAQLPLGKLQVEYDHFFYRSVVCILSAPRVGALQFLSDLPYQQLSHTMQWQLLWLLHVDTVQDTPPEEATTITQIKALLQESDMMVQMEDKLCDLEQSEAIFLLTACTNMARSHRGADNAFVDMVVTHLYQVCYVSSRTREFCSKVGRELLSSICLVHPKAVSTLLERVGSTMDHVGLMSLYLYKEMPLHLWLPQSPDMVLLETWLLQSELHTPEHRLARLIAAQLNWGTNAQGDRLFLPLELHRWMGLLLTQVSNHFMYNKEQAGLIAAGIKQVTQLAAAARLTVGPDQQLTSWLWEVALQLRLHATEQPQPALSAGTIAQAVMEDVPNFTNDSSLQHLQRAVKTDMPIALYIALAMTSVGHDKSEFLSSGLPLLLQLVEGGHIVPTIHVLAKITPLFLTCQHNILQEKRLLKVVEKVIQSDHSLTSSDMGPHCKLLCSMIQFQVQSGFVSARVSSTTVLELWVRLLTSLPQWWYNPQVLQVLDSLLQTAFRCKGGEDMTISILYDRYKALLSTKTDPGVLVSLVSWMSSSTGPPTFLDKPTQTGVWVAYQVLQAESMWEEDTQLRKMLENALQQDSNISVDGAVKNVSSELHLPSAPPIHRLMIYRWAQQALATPLDHPLLPLIWQRFFQIYLHRPAADSGMSGRGGVGHRFFQAHAQSSLLKRLKKRLQETADFHYAASKKPTMTLDISSDTAPEDQREEPLVPSSDSAGVHHNLSKLFHSFYLWIDEPRLHDPNLYLPALPQQYDAERLLSLFKNSQDTWLEFVDMDRVERDIAVMATEWVQHRQVKTVAASRPSPDFSQPATSPMERHLMTSDLTQPPPSSGEMEPPVPGVPPQVLEDTTLLLATVEPHLQHLLHQARMYTEREQRHLTLDNTYLDLIPDHYHNKHVQLTLQIPCHSSFSLNSPSCKGPAQITLQYQEKTVDHAVDGQLKENRHQAEQVVDGAMSPPQQQLCASALFVERLITDLVNHSYSQQQEGTARQDTREVGTSLFYKLVRCVDEDNRQYPPTRQFFSSCIETLGQAFIRNNPTQAEFLLRAMLIMDSEFIGKNPDEAGKLLQATLAAPALCGLLGPHFSPNQAGVAFINMYTDVTRVPDSHGVDLAFMLLTKFDVQMWLESCRPSLTDRSLLVDTIRRALLLCGPEPKTDMLMVFEVYQSHLQSMLRYSFPDHFGDVLKVLLQGSDSKQLSPVCWKTTLRTLGCTELGSTADSVTLASLTPEQVTETLGWLASHYMKLRTGSQQLTVNGLYCEMEGYVQHIAQLLGLLFTTLLQTEPGGSVVPSHSFESEVESLWALLQSAYEPWIASLDAAKLGPSSVPSGVGLCMPWTEKESELAAGVMDNFTNCLQLLFTKYEGALPTHSQDVLALTWRYYASSLARSDQPHVLKVYHDSLVTLPWEHFYPDIHAFNLMMKLLEESHPVCQSFLCSVFIRLDCVTMVSDYCSHDLPEIVARLHQCLLHLLVHFSVQEGEVVRGKIHEAERFGWHYLSAAAYQSTMSWLVDAANPDLVLFLGQPSPQPLRLMKIAAGFKPEMQVQYGDASRKQQLYVHGVVELVCRCVARRKVDISCYQPVITGLLGDIESLAGSALDSHHQHSQMVALLSEALGLLNNCPPDERKVETLARFFWEWLESNSCSCLVLPVVTAGCRTLASPAHMARMVECGIEVFLISGLVENVQNSWDQVLAAVEIPELAQEDFLSECLEHGCFLTLYAYVLQRLPMGQGPKDEMRLAEQLLTWTAAAKPRADNEAKLLLWWWQVLRICLQQVDRNLPLKDVFCALMNLTSSLTTLGEDKSATGLLGALGLGKRSPLSHRFRLVCRGLSTFLLAQARSVSFLRLQPGDPHAVGQALSGPLPGVLPTTEGPSPKAVQSLANLEALQTNKQYSSLKSHIQYIYSFTVDPLHTLRDAPPLLTHLAQLLFQDQNYLSLLHVQAQGTYHR